MCGVEWLTEKPKAHAPASNVLTVTWVSTVVELLVDVKSVKSGVWTSETPNDTVGHRAIEIGVEMVAVGEGTEKSWSNFSSDWNRRWDFISYLMTHSWWLRNLWFRCELPSELEPLKLFAVASLLDHLVSKFVFYEPFSWPTFVSVLVEVPMVLRQVFISLPSLAIELVQMDQRSYASSCLLSYVCPPHREPFAHIYTRCES